MKKSKLLSTCFIACMILASTVTFAQSIGDYWYFGQKAGINFAPVSHSPSPLVNGAMNTSEGCATISDNTGHLIFYTDGKTVWNNLHAQIATGLQGDASSTQSAIITPRPISNEYYIFTVGAWGAINNGYGKGINYYLVKTSPYSVTPKGLLLGGNANYPICEKITAVCKNDSLGNFTGNYWLIAHRFGVNSNISSTFYVWEITTSGPVNPPLSIQQQIVGDSHGTTIQDGVAGYLKASQQGDKLALAFTGTNANYNDGFFDLFSFNNVTGQIRHLNAFHLGQPNLPRGTKPYGVEFSPDGKFFYGTLANRGVYQFNTNSPYNVNVVHEDTSKNFQALQLAIDGNIYAARSNKTYLSRILTPNGPPTWSEIGVNLNGKKCSAGLPNFVQCLIPVPPSNKTCCPDLINLIKNSGFDQPLAPSTSSQYILDGTPSLNSTIPGKYAIINGSQAKNICNNWKVQDHSSCDDNSGHFMVVNGETTQPSNINNIIWQQTVIGIVKDSTYQFCVYMKNLPACCFDVLPKVQIEFTPGGLLPWTIIQTTTSDPCDWQLVKFTFQATSTSVTIKIYLNETQKGDGNDLAIDDISLVKLLPVPKQFTLVTLTPVNVTTTTFNLSATQPQLNFINDCGYWWQICELDANYNCIPGTILSNLPAWWTYPNPCTFGGYVFSLNKKYRISYGVWCTCLSWNASSWIWDPGKGKIKKPIFKEDKNFKISTETINEIIKK